MTICVAAICEHSQCVAIATDLLKVNQGNVISGTVECKLRSLSSSASLIYSGLSTHIHRTLGGLGEVDGLDLLSISKLFQERYSDCLNEVFEERFIRPNLGISYRQFVATNQDVAMVLRNNYLQANDLCIRSVILGVDDAGAHIIQATPALMEDSAGFYSIGIGEELAIWSQRFLTMQRYDSNCSAIDGLFTACFAKTVAQERGLAMGEETDLALQTRQGLIRIEPSLKNAIVTMCRRRIDRLKISSSERVDLESIGEDLLNSLRTASDT